ncbi:hypothetical protein Rhow_002354 [Rhodococcus wratislaviensis]|uniref:Uncharacterized protein n=1 Tax=Rhodococcus wratislaviensis TaxID=44752 RepID=A0A402C5D2_RHOWR|nr:hypothetical protein Rhow_002354 [Rhodococcus wratislaviensis]
MVPCSWQRGGPITLASDIRLPTTAVDQVLDELSSLARSPRVPT